MNLWDIQSTIKTLLEADSNLDGVPVLLDDGTFPKTPDLEEARTETGLVLIVFSVISRGVLDQNRGRILQRVGCPVVVEEFVKMNRGTGGTGITAEKATSYVISALLDKPTTIPSQNRFGVDDAPWENLGTTADGVLRIVVNVTCNNTITATA